MGWAAAAFVLQAVGSMQQAQQQQEAANRQAQYAADAAAASAANFQRQDAELLRQQQETQRVQGEQKSDRMRQANEDLASARAASAEGFGGTSGARAAGEIAYIEGLDLSRLESNTAGRIASLQASKDAARTGATNASREASASAANAKALEDGAGLRTALAIGGAAANYGARKELYSAAQTRASNKTGFQLD